MFQVIAFDQNKMDRIPNTRDRNVLFDGKKVQAYIASVREFIVRDLFTNKCMIDGLAWVCQSVIKQITYSTIHVDHVIKFFEQINLRR